MMVDIIWNSINSFYHSILFFCLLLDTVVVYARDFVVDSGHNI